MYDFLYEELKRVRPAFPRIPENTGLTMDQYLRAEEAKVREQIDDLVLTCIVQRQPVPEDSRLRFWLCWRLMWAVNWLPPLATHRKEEQLEFYPTLNWLLIVAWPSFGLDNLIQSAQAKTFQLLESPDDEPPSDQYWFAA